MLSNCLKCRKNTESKIPKVSETHKGKLCIKEIKMCSMWFKKSRFINEQDTSGLLSCLKIKKHPLLGNTLF